MRVLIFFILAFVMFPFDLEAQNARKAYKIGVQSFENREFIRAVGWLTKAIESQTNKYNDAYIYRAKANRKLGRTQEALDDFKKATQLFPDNYKVALEAAKLLYRSKAYNSALQYATTTLDRDAGNFEAVKIQALALTLTGKAESALIITDEVSKSNEDAMLLYAKALASDSLGLTDYAMAYYKQSISTDSAYKPPYHALTRLFVRNGYLNKAIDVLTQAAKQFNDKESFKLRAILHGAMGHTQSQINDITEILTLDPARLDLYFKRAKLYEKANLFQNALNDINYYLQWDSLSAPAWLLKAGVLNALYMKDDAISAFEKVIDLTENAALKQSSRDALYRLNKENAPPQIIIEAPQLFNDSTLVVGNKDRFLNLKGIITDSSKINSLMINGRNVNIEPQQNGVRFSIQLPVDSLNIIRLAVSDIYHNEQKQTYLLKRTGKNPPKLVLTDPNIGKDSILHARTLPYKIKGYIIAQSALKKLVIAGKSISFNQSGNRYYFSDKLDFRNIDTLIISANDHSMNTAAYKFPVQVPDSLMKKKLIGEKTWFVLISSDSINQQIVPPVQSLHDSLIDVLAQYNIDSTLVYRRLTKEAIERKLLFELPEQTRNNRVESVIIHYIGVGIAEEGFTYWLVNSTNADKAHTKFNTSIFSAVLTALSHVKRKGIVSESVYPAKSIWQTVESPNAGFSACEKQKKQRGHFAMGIRVDNWHTYQSKMYELLKMVLKEHRDCFSPLMLDGYENIRYGKVLGVSSPLVPVFLYPKKGCP